MPNQAVPDESDDTKILLRSIPDHEEQENEVAQDIHPSETTGRPQEAGNGEQIDTRRSKDRYDAEASCTVQEEVWR